MVHKINSLDDLVDYLMSEVVYYVSEFDMAPTLREPYRRFEHVMQNEQDVWTAENPLGDFFWRLMRWLSEPSVCAHCRRIVSEMMAGVVNTLLVEDRGLTFKRFVELLADLVDAEGWLVVRQRNGAVELKSNRDFRDSRDVAIDVRFPTGRRMQFSCR